ncbi:polysaccharide deacetylase family protein [Actinomadura sp. DC4]|uniref:polysaccharide deacetylase family protein n=1 Tax=Actinomadura sp. DC4 TaxID=3055069 RepID=UPI0025B0C685|nr:polysaccharide deacetylase family protein [Actinomadura sp. DC4]MDN3358349.1 polysaccharide deacetylase family protein [Actinomadura sp. DC4]
MALRPPARAATAAACTLIAAGGLTACHDATRAAARTPTPSGNARNRRPSGKPPKAHTPAPATMTLAPAGPLPPVISNVPVHGRLVFITIDDGWEKDPSFVGLIRREHIPLTLFLTNAAVRDDYGYFRGLQRTGALIEDHTMTHPEMRKLSYEKQRAEICGPAGIYAREYGARPTLFRAPYGATDTDTLRAARDCRMKAVIFWREVVTGGRIAYQKPGRLHPGDILLVHFKPNMTADFKRMLHTIGKQGFRPAALKKHLPARYFRR